MSKKLLLLSAGLILSSLSLAGCNKGGLPGTSSTPSAEETTQATSEQEISTSSEDKPVAGRIVVAEDEETAADINKKVLPVDIVIDQVVNLEDHVEVTKVSTWSLTTESANVSIEGHTFKALDYGDYTVTIIAGTTKRAIHGYVVTPKKAKFDAYYAGIDANDLSYVLGGQISGLMVVEDKYYVEASQDSDGNVTLEGAIAHPTDGKYYSFELSGVYDGQGELVDFGDAMTMKKGYGRSHASHGFGEYLDLIKPTDFIEAYDSDGDPTGYYIYENTIPDEFGESKAQQYIDSLVGGSVWSIYENYLMDADDPTATLNIAAKFDVDKTTGLQSVSLYPASKEGKVYRNIRTDSSTFKTDIVISGIGEADIDACEAWLLDPELPEQVDITPLRNAADAIFEAKAYEMSYVAQWVNISSASPIDVPDYMCFSDGTPVFSNYAVSGAVNSQIVEYTYNNVTPGAYLPDDTIVLPEAGTSEVNFVDNKLFYSASKGPSDNEWGAPTSDAFSEDPEDDIWVSTLVPYFLQATEKLDLLGIASFYDSFVDEETGNTVFKYNTNGEDMNYGRNKYYAGMAFYFASLCPNMLGWIPVFYMNYMDWWTDATISFEISPNGDLSFNWTLLTSTTEAYVVATTFENIGVDAVSEGAKQVYRDTTGKALPGDEDIPQESSSEETSNPEISEDSTPIDSNLEVSEEGSLPVESGEEESIPSNSEEEVISDEELSELLVSVDGSAE